MKLSHTPEEEKFASEVRAWLDEALPEDKRHTYSALEHSDKEVMLWWSQKLAEKGWLVRHWPTEYGGTGWTLAQHHLFNKELQSAGAPSTSGFGTVMVGPVIYTFGNEEQKKRFLPGIQNGTELWCQGYSEPGSGSDLASLKTRAVREGDHYVVNGQKIWTTQAHWADRIFCLVRTNTEVKAQEGISFLLIDMDTPGIEVRPIVSIDGLHHLNEVYFTDVKVPVENLIGEENKGWTYAKFLLGNERTATANASATRQRLERLKVMAKSKTSFSDPMIEDASFAKRLAETETKLTALEITEARSIDADDASFDAVKLSLPLKYLGTNLQQEIAEMCVELVGYAGLPREFEDAAPRSTNEPSLFEKAPGLMESHLFGRAATIYGGTSEVQKNIMAKMVLQL